MDVEEVEGRNEPMEWTISFLSGQQIVVFQTQGVADRKSSLEMASSVAKTMLQYKAIRCLIDYSALQSVTGRPFEIYPVRKN